MRAVLERSMEKLREILDTGKSRSRSNSEEYAYLLADEILNQKDLTEDE